MRNTTLSPNDRLEESGRVLSVFMKTSIANGEMVREVPSSFLPVAVALQSAFGLRGSGPGGGAFVGVGLGRVAMGGRGWFRDGRGRCYR